jgi:hypothetical protein
MAIRIIQLALIACRLGCLVAPVAAFPLADAQSAPTFYSSSLSGLADEAAFDSKFPTRFRPSFTNANDTARALIRFPELDIFQYMPRYPSLLDSDNGFVWTTSGSNNALGNLRFALTEPAAAIGLRYNWIPSGSPTGDLGELSLTVNGQRGVVASLTNASFPFQQGWVGVSDEAQPFRLIDIDFSGMTGSLAFYFFDATDGDAVEIAPAPALAGDYNGDGNVNAADYNVWRSNYGSTALAPAAGADGNADGLVNAADYTVWRDKVSAQPAAIPEPTTLMAVAVITLLFSIWRPWLRASCRLA